MTLDITLRSRLNRFIAPDLLDRLPEVDALAEAIRRLGGLYKTIGSFVPGYVADDERLLTSSAGMLRPGAFLFADVSGFTALSEKLQQHGGEAGAETLTLVINDYFSTMLEILAKSDGQLLKFAGDALLTFFPGELNESASKAIRTGLRMQRAMTRFQPIQTPELAQLLGEHDQRLSMSIGVSHGKLLEAYVGNSMQRDHLIQGRLPGSAMAAEGAGDKDDVIVTQALAEATASEFTFAPVEEAGFQRVLDTLGDTLDDYEFRILARRRAKSGALFDFEQDNLLESLRTELDRVEKVSRFMAPAVLNELVSSGGDHLQSQNRIVVTMFVHVSGFADMLERWGEDRLPVLVSILERYYSIMQRIISVHGGSITRSDPYQLGMKLLITFGAPVSNPDDPQRAVTAALEMQRQLKDFNLRLHDEMEADIDGLPIQQRIGITLGVVFAGEVGWRARREYTVMGDDVNLSARLMSKAGMGQTLISDRVWRRVSHLFEAAPVEPLQLKGKSKLIQAYVVTGVIARPVGLPSTSDTPFTGREALFGQLVSTLNNLKHNPGLRAVRLCGESGVGKTRLARELASTGEAANLRVAWATCSLKTERRQTWASIVSQLLRVDLNGDEQARQTLKSELAALDLAQLEPAFAELLFEAITPTEPEPKPTPEAAPKRRSIFDLATSTSEINAHDSGVFKLADSQLSGVSGEKLRTKTGLWKHADMRTSPDVAVIRFLRAFTQRCPTLIIIDDAHRENPQALQILQRVAQDTGPMTLMLVIAHEPATLPVETPSMDVTDLSQEETALMAARFLAVSDVGPRLRQLVWTRTNGRPLYVESLLLALIEQSAIVQMDTVAELAEAASVDALPEDVRKLVISRVDRLAPAAQTTLRSAAVLGEQFVTQALWAVTGIEALEDLEAILRDLTEADMVEPAFDGDYRFRHGMTQRAIYESLPRLVRQKLHRTAAEYWSKQAARPLVVAHHWLNGGMPLRAIETINAAAEAAEAKHDTAGAIELYSAALDILPNEKSWQTQIERLKGTSGVA